MLIGTHIVSNGRALVLLGSLAVFALTGATTTVAQDQVAPTRVVIGVLATEGSTRAIEEWSEAVAALNKAATDQEEAVVFTMEPHTHDSLLTASEQGSVNLVLTDPAQFVRLSVESGARAIVSRGQIWDNQTVDRTGALIFARADSGRRSIRSLKGARVMAVAPNGFSGWWLAEKEFLRRRLDPADFLDSVVFSGSNEREVVYAVQAGLVDAGIVRTGLMESLARQGVIELADFVPVSPVSFEDFPFISSTALYPEQVLSALPGVPEEVLALTINTLLSMPPPQDTDSTVVHRVWQAPQNYQSVHDLLIQLRVAPYENYYLVAASRILTTYRWPALGLVLLALGSIVFLIYELRRNTQLAEERRNVLQSEVRSKLFYRNAIEEHTVFCMLSRDGIISHVNDQFVSILERNRSKLINSQLSDLISDGERERVLAEILASVEAGAPWQGAIRLSKADESVAWVQCTFIPVTSSSKELSEIALVATDVSQTTTGVSEDRFQDTLELIQDQVVVLRPGDFEVLYCNAMAEKKLIKDRMGGEWRGESVSRFISNDDMQMLRMRAEAIEQGPQRRIIWEAEDKAGTTFEISLEYCQPEHEEPRIVAMYRDVTERKVAEKAKNEFIATVSHELRTPLTSMKGALSLAASGAAGELPEKVEKLVKLAGSNCERLHMLINDILDLEKIVSGNMDFKMERLDLKQLVEESVEENQHYANQFGVTYITRIVPDEDGLFTMGDRRSLRQVMDNLMSNAAKFSVEGSEVEISLLKYKGRMRISVRDYGSGIPKAAQATIFDKFTQADSSDTRSKGGTGLGLAIARQIVDSHRGHLHFFSEEQVGTEFFCDLPAMVGDAVLDIPADKEGGDTAEAGFSNAIGDDASEDFVAPDEREFQMLLDMVRQMGVGIKVETNRVNAVQVAKGRGVISQSRALTWLDGTQRNLLSDLLNRGQMDNRAVSIVEMDKPTSVKSDQIADTCDLVSLVADWLNETIAGSGEVPPYKLSGVALVPDGVSEQPDNCDITFVNNSAEALLVTEQDKPDFIAWFGLGTATTMATVFPLKNGRLSEGLPLTLIVSHNPEQSVEQGIVSKFTSIDGGGRGRARRRGSADAGK